MGAEKGLSFFKTVLDYYSNIHFDKFHMKTICEYTTELLNEQGYQYNGEIKKITGLNIYPVDYFCPMNYYTGEILITENTCSIHHYTATWITDKGYRPDYPQGSCWRGLQCRRSQREAEHRDCKDHLQRVG